MPGSKSAQPQPSSILLRGARLVLPERVTSPASLVVREGRIARIEEDVNKGTLQAEATFDLEGLTLFPGLIDLHIHGALGVDTMEADADDLRRVASYLAEGGVTGWLPTLVPAPAEDYTSAVRAVEQLMREQRELAATTATPETPTARALGLHYEGPFVSGDRCGALRTEHFRVFKGSADLDGLPILDLEGASHMMTLAPEIEGGIDLIRELRARGWIASIGHTSATPEQLERARDAGARHMTHFMNAMLPIHQRAPGPVGWGLVRDDVTCDIIADGQHSDPLMLQLVLRCKGAERVALISDAVAPAGLGDGDYTVWGETIGVRNGRTSNARGNIAGSVIHLRDAVRLLARLGVAQTELSAMAARNPARLLGLADECGTLETGKRADLVAFDDDYRPRLTLVGGRVAFDALS
ncbi:MAG TPA: N-acetylglucosamine-6-phosphate deacetylase [Pyrinomonadaceae bacterium]|jgi:N-acetylglucosamine-6-phosphate deacetylase